MNRRRLIIAGFFTLLMLAVLAVIVYTERANATASVDAWILIHDVPAGAPYASADVEQVSIRASATDFNYEVLGPAQVAARYARGLSAHDIVRTDDLVPASSQVEVALSVQSAPPLNPGDLIDVYATTATSTQALIGRGLTVESVTGAVITVLVPAPDESAWVAVGSSNVTLHVARISAVGEQSSAPVDSSTAISILCGPPCAGLGAPSP